MKVEIVCIIDRSGSMNKIKNDAIGGFNTFLQEQKEVPGEATMTYVQFDDRYEVVFENKDIQKVEPIDDKIYVPRGWTRLNDAIGRTVVTVGERLSKMDENDRPKKVIVCILTDGEENDSREYTDTSKIKEMIKHQKEKYNWEFIYLGADQDAFKEGAKYGIDLKDIQNFDRTARGIKMAYGHMSHSTTQYRNG